MLFNTKGTGHHAEHVHHLFRHGEEVWPDAQFLAVVPSRIVESIRDDAGEAHQLIELDTEEVREVHSQESRWRRSLAEWNLAKKYACRLDVDHCILLDLNWFQFALGLPSARTVPFSLSGIFFFPFVRLSPMERTGTDCLREGVRYVRKWGVAWWMMRNSTLENVFVLNDPTAAEQLNDQVDPSRHRFQSIPDPVPPVSEPPSDIEPLHEAYALDENRYTFLFTGTVSRRKGVLTALDAFKHLGEAEQVQCSLVLAGRLVDDVVDEVRQRVDHLRQNTKVEVRTDFRFLSDAEFQRGFFGCDVVLAPYQRTEGSSGLLSHVARTRRPVIGPCRGLIGDLIDRYELGMTVDATQDTSVTRAIRTVLTKEVRVGERAKDYLRERTPKRFAQCILSSIQ